MNVNEGNIYRIPVTSTNHREALTRYLLSLCLVVTCTSCHNGVVRSIDIEPSELVCPGDMVEVFWNADGKVKIEQSGGATSIPETAEGELNRFTATVNETTTFTISRHSSSVSATIEVLTDGHIETIDLAPFCGNCGKPGWIAEFLPTSCPKTCTPVRSRVKLEVAQ